MSTISVNMTEEVALVTIRNVPNSSNMMCDIFEGIASANINVDMISQSLSYDTAKKVSFTVSDSDVPSIITVLSKFKKDSIKIDINSGNCKLVASGSAMKSTPGFAAKTLRALNGLGKVITTSEVDISVLVDAKDAEAALSSVSSAF